MSRALLATASLLAGCGNITVKASPDAGEGFAHRPYLFRAEEARLRASTAADDPEATGQILDPDQPVGFLTLAKAAQADRASYSDFPTWQLAFAGWLLGDASLSQLARDEAMAVVNASPGGDQDHSYNYQHVEERLLAVAATADLAFAQFSEDQLAQVAAWVNGTLAHWHEGNLSYWPLDDELSDYWQNGYLATVIGGIATEGFNPQAASWRTKADAMSNQWIRETAPPAWTGPVQSGCQSYGDYLHHALWAMELSDGALGTHTLADSQLSASGQLDLLMFQTRPSLVEFFSVGSVPSSNAPFTALSFAAWHHFMAAAPTSPQAHQARGILDAVQRGGASWGRASKAFVNFYWSTRNISPAPLAAKADRLFMARSAGIVGLRSQAGFQTNARAAVVFANPAADGARHSHAHPDAPGFQWASGADWLVVDPDSYASSGILGETTGAGSDISNIVTLADHPYSRRGAPPVVTYAEDHLAEAIPHLYVQIDAQPYWTSATTYRRDYVWLDDLQVLVLFDRVVGPDAKTWRLHVPAAPAISGSSASYLAGGKAATIRSLLPAGAAWSVENLRPSLTQRDVWRLSQADAAEDYTSLKVLDIDGRVTRSELATGAGSYEVQLGIGSTSDRVVRFFADGSHAEVQ